jgi:WD40 repeat protein/tetratricopeptide (TPR) repeat protein
VPLFVGGFALPRLFISHSSRDNVYALAFQNWLTANGWASEDVFVDLHGIGAGERWRDTLRKANAACEAVVLLASPDSLGSVECQKELELAEVLGKEIILAIIRDLTKDSPLLARYTERQFVDLSAFPQDHVEGLEYEGRTYRVAFNPQALAAIKDRLDDLGIAPGSFAWPPKGRPKAAPYPGLAAFGEDDAGIFFGREADIMSALAEIRLVRRRRGPRLIVIDAASGSGKSSFLRAGLWPRLRRDPDFAPLAILRPAQGVLSGPDGLGRRLAPWFERHGRPRAPGTIHTSVGAVDDAAGAAALARLIAEATELATETRRAAVPDAKPPALLIAIDQAEELFSSEHDAESRRLLSALSALLAEPPEGSDPYVLATIRADSVQSLLVRVAELGLETPKVLYLPPLSPAAYREVILRPAEVYSERVRRLAIEPALAQALVQDAAGADALPLLAFSLGRLFTDYAAEGELTLAHYRQMGGASGSIARALKEAQGRAGASGSNENLRRLIVPRLATWDPDADQHKGAAKRLVASWGEVAGGDRAGLAHLAEALIEARLLTRSADALEVAHEALLRQPPISDWLAEDRDFLMWRDRLGRARAQFDANERGLLVGRELQIARDWLVTRAADVAPPDRAFIDASAAEDDRRRSAEERTERERQAAELAASRRVQRRTVMGMLASLVFALMAAGAWLQASTQRDAAIEANYQKEQSRLKYLTTSATRAAEDGDTTTGLLLAMEAMPESNGDKGMMGAQGWWPVVPSRDAMFRAVRQLVLPEDQAEKIRGLREKGAPHLYSALRIQRELAILSGHTSTINRVAISPDGALIVTGSGDKTARVWDAKTGAELLKLEGHSEHINSVAVVPGSNRIVTGSGDRTARVWDSKTGKELFQLKGHTGAVIDVAAWPDATRIVTGSEDKTARIWDAETGKELLRLKGHTGSINAVAVMPGDRVVTGASDNTALVWDAKKGSVLLQLKGHTRSIFDVAVSEDGTRVVTGSEDKSARIWDAETGKELSQLAHGVTVYEVAMSRDAALVVTGSQQDARVWDARTGTELFKLKGHTGIVWGIAVMPDGSRIVTGSEDGTARIWDARTGPELLAIKGHSGLIWGVAMTPDGTRVVTGAWGRGQARVWDAKSGAELFELKGHTADVNGIALSPDGARIATGSDDSITRIWDTDTGALQLQLEGHRSNVYAVAFSPDGSRILTGSGDNTARVWDAKTGKELLQLAKHTNTVYSVAFSRDGSRIVTGSADYTTRVWNAETGEPLLQLKKHTGTVNGVAFSPDGTSIITGSADSTVRIWDARTGDELRQLKGHTGAIRSVALTADGTRIATGSEDKTARVWDAKTGVELFQLKGHTGTVYGVAWSQDGAQIITGSADTTARIWQTFGSVETELHHAKGNAPRCLTPGERQRYDLPPMPPRWCAEKWPYDPISASILGKTLFESGRHDEANSLFASARDLAGQPTAAKRIDETWAGILFDRGRNLIRNNKDDEAKAFFAQALARDPAMAKRIDEAWAGVLIGRAGNLARDGKDGEAKTLFDEALARDPAAGKRIKDAWVRALLDRGENLVRGGKDDEAKATFDQVLTHDPAATKRIDSAWARALLDRGTDLVRDGKNDSADGVFAKALAHDASAAGRIDAAWVSGFLDRGWNLVNARRGDDTTQEAKRLQDALDAFQKAIARNRSGNTGKDHLADALFGRGQVYDSLKRYTEAIEDFRAATRLGKGDAESWAFWAANRHADQLRDQGKLAAAVLKAAGVYLELTPELRRRIAVRNLKSHVSVWTPMGRLHADLVRPAAAASVTDCDRKVAHPDDPLRTGAGTHFDKVVDPKQIVAACDLAIGSQPNEMRFRFQKGRALSKVARLSGAASLAKKIDTDAVAELQAAAAGGYPIAFNNLALAYQRGEGAPKDEEKASDLYLEGFNRMVHCCWVPVARHLLAHANEHDPAQVRRVVHELALWARALGSEPARQLLSELYANGTLTQPANPPADEKAAFNALPPWLRDSPVPGSADPPTDIDLR